MLVKPGHPIVDISGPISGVSYHRDKSGLHISATRSPRNPNSPSQRETRAAFSRCRIAWQHDTTGTQRHLWEIYAALHPHRNRLGEPVPLSGWHWFSRVNMYRILTDCPITLRPPLE